MLSHKSLNKLLLLLLLLTLSWNWLNWSKKCHQQQQSHRAQPTKLRFAIEKLEAMVEGGLPASGLQMDDIEAAYLERLDYSTWRKLASQRVFDLFYDLIDFIQSSKPSAFLHDKYKPTTIAEFENWYKKLRPFYLQAALIELDKIMKEMEEMERKEEAAGSADDKLLEAEDT